MHYSTACNSTLMGIPSMHCRLVLLHIDFCSNISIVVHMALLINLVEAWRLAESPPCLSILEGDRTRDLHDLAREHS